MAGPSFKRVPVDALKRLVRENPKGVSPTEVAAAFDVPSQYANAVCKAFAEQYLLKPLAERGIHLDNMQVNFYFLTRKIGGENVYEHLASLARNGRPAGYKPVAQRFGYTDTTVKKIMDRMEQNPKNRMRFSRMSHGGLRPGSKRISSDPEKKRYLDYFIDRLERIRPDMPDYQMAKMLGTSEDTIARHRKPKARTPKPARAKPKTRVA